MSFDYCQKCKKFDGWIERHSFSGRKLKSVRCADHSDAFYVCDVCRVRVRMVFGRNHRGERTEQPEAGGNFEYVENGQGGGLFKKNAHVCPECAAAIREAQQVAFDSVVARRGELRAGVTLGTPPAPPPA